VRFHAAGVDQEMTDTPHQFAQWLRRKLKIAAFRAAQHPHDAALLNAAYHLDRCLIHFDAWRRLPPGGVK